MFMWILPNHCEIQEIEDRKYEIVIVEMYSTIAFYAHCELSLYSGLYST